MKREAPHTPLRRAAVAVARYWPAYLLVCVLVGVWELWVRLGGVEPTVVPPPSRVAQALGHNSSTLLDHSATTLGETLIGLAIGVVVGLIVATAITLWQPARRAIEPLLVVIQTIPPLVLAPVFVLAFGFGWTPRVLVVVLIVFFPVAIAAAGAFMAADPDRVAMLQAMGARRSQVWRYVTVPGAVPAIVDGMRISAAYAVAGAAIAEQIGGARSGLGLFIARSQRSFRADQVMAGVVVIAVLSLAVYGAITLAGRAATPWRAHLVEARP